MEVVQCVVFAIASFVMFVHLLVGAGKLATKTKAFVYFPLCLLIALDVGVFVCSVGGNIDLAKLFASLAFVAGSVYAIVLYCSGIVIHKHLNESQPTKVS